MKEEGVIKFNCKWEKGIVAPTVETNNLIVYRQKLFAKKLIGFDKQLKVGYGNISIRQHNSDSFYITGTQTGGETCLKMNHIVLVNEINIEKNEVRAVGEIKASSESLTHGILYKIDPNINAVIHIHHKATWEYWINKAPTTAENIPYGTPEMADEVSRLFKEKNLMKEHFFIMGGHEDGVFTFASAIEDAYEEMIKRLIIK